MYSVLWYLENARVVQRIGTSVDSTTLVLKSISICSLAGTTSIVDRTFDPSKCLDVTQSQAGYCKYSVVPFVFEGTPFMIRLRVWYFDSDKKGPCKGRFVLGELELLAYLGDHRSRE